MEVEPRPFKEDPGQGGPSTENPIASGLHSFERTSRRFRYSIEWLLKRPCLMEEEDLVLAYLTKYGSNVQNPN